MKEVTKVSIHEAVRALCEAARTGAHTLALAENNTNFTVLMISFFVFFILITHAFLYLRTFMHSKSAI